jgi:hypothetical protein
MTMATIKKTVTLYRPTGPRELELIRAGNFRSFPPRGREQPFFYPVLHEDYAVQIARDWNANHPSGSGIGFVTRFQVRGDFIGRYQVRTVGSYRHKEYWIPAEDIQEFNRNLVGEIEIIAEFRKDN